MSTQRRIIDASKGLPSVNKQVQQPNVFQQRPQQPVQQVRIMQQPIPQARGGTVYVPKQVVRQQPPIAHNVTVGINPNANLIYQEQQPPTQAQVTNQLSAPPVQKAQSVQKEQRTNILQQDPEMKEFDLTGCNSVNDAYNKNAGKIKIIPE